MPRYAANLTLMYTEHAWADRFAAAAADGFEAVECQFPYGHPQVAANARQRPPRGTRNLGSGPSVSCELSADALAQLLRRHGLQLVLFNLWPGDWAAGERGLAALPGREAEFAASVQKALVYARATGCTRLHAMAGVVPPHVSEHDRAAMHRTYVSNLRLAAQTLAPHGITLLIEPINTRDMPGYALHHQQQAHDVVAEVGAPNLKVLMDLYHCQIMEGDVATRLRRHIGGVGHLQIAGVPDRHEPDEGELNYPYLFALIDALGYCGHIGCEYRPRAGTSAGLGWWHRERVRRARELAAPAGLQPC